MNYSSKKYKSFIVVLVFLLSSFIVNSQTSPTYDPALTSGGANSLVFRFTKQVWLNPTIILARKEFEASTHVKLLLLPRINNNDTSSNSKLENAFDKVFALLYSDEITGSIKFYFNSQNTTKPFTFATSEELWCKFTPAQKDTVEQLLNKVVARNNDMSDFSKLPFDSVINQASRYCKKILLSNTGTCGDNPKQVFSSININSTPAKLNFEQAPFITQPTGDVDEQQYDALKAYYNTATDSADNSNYPIAWQAMSGSNDVIKLKLKKNSPNFNLADVKFKNSGGTETYSTQLSPTYSEILNINITGKPAGTMAEVVAYYTAPRTPNVAATTYPIGAFNVQFYQTKPPLKLVLVNLGNAKMPDIKAVQEELTKTYGSIFINWDVSVIKHDLPNSLSKNLTIESSNLLSNYPPSMQPIIKDFKSKNNVDANTYYLFFGCTNNNSLLGYMPRARNIGFIFDSSPHTIAHELGHGAFNLKHIFSSDELGEGNRGQTDNLMDYAPVNGSATNPQDALYKYQWDLIHNPSFVGWFEGDDEEGAFTAACAFDAGGKNFIAPNGKVFRLPIGSKILATRSVHNDGALYDFVKDNKLYVADAQIMQAATSFKGYKNKGVVYPAINYLQKAENVYVIFSKDKVMTIYSIASYTAPGDAVDNNLEGVVNSNHILENQDAFDNQKTVFVCSANSAPDITADEFFEKIKNKPVSTNTYFYKDGTLITLSPAKPAEKKACTELQLNNLKQQIAAGAFTEKASVLFETTETGYKTTIGFNKSIEAKYGSSSDVKKECINILQEKTAAYLKNAKDLTAAATIEEDGTFTDGKKFELVFDQTLYTLIGNVVHDAAKFIQEAEIPESYYNSQNEAYSKNWIHSPPLPTGLANGVIEEIKDIPVLVAFGADIALNANTRNELKKALKKLNSWDSVKIAAIAVVTGWTDKYSNGGDVAWHQAGKDAVGIYSVGKAAAALVSVFKKGVEKEAGNVAEAVGKMGGTGNLASKLKGIAKNAHENLKLGGVKFIDDGNSIKYLTKNGTEFAKIENGKILLTAADGKWPLPSEYLDVDYISAHLAKFDGGVTKITSYNPTGTVGPPGGTFVLPKSQADLLIKQAGGDVSKLEDLLGLKRGDLGTNPFRIDVSNPSGLRMSSGNEAGANEFWIPAGKTSGGILEVTIDQIQLGTYIKKIIF